MTSPLSGLWEHVRASCRTDRKSPSDIALQQQQQKVVALSVSGPVLTVRVGLWKQLAASVPLHFSLVGSRRVLIF